MPKTSPAVSADAPVVKTTTIREVLNPSELNHQPSTRKTPDFWEFVHNIPDEKLGEFMIYLYRTEPGRVQIDHTSGKTFDVPGYGLVPIIDQEGIETAVTADCGGGTYRLICRNRRDSQIVTYADFRIDLPARNITPWFVKRGENKPAGNGQPQYAGDGTAQVAGQAIQTMSGIQAQMMTPVMEMWKTATSTVKDFVNRPAANSEGDEFEKRLRQELMARALAPPPDPLEQMTKFLQLKSQLDGSSGSGDMNFDKLRSMIAFVREFSGTASPAVSMGAEIVRSVSNMVPNVVEGINAWARGREAERDTVAIMRSQPQPRPGQPSPMGRPPQVLPASFNQNPNSAAQAPIPASMSQPNPNQPNPTNAQGNGAPSLEFLEDKIVEIFRKPCSAEQAAEEALDFLESVVGDNPDPQHDIVAQLASRGEHGLIELFQTREHLRPITVNTGRMLDFIRAFLRYHAEDLAAEQRKPN